MKRFLFLAALALALVSCKDDKNVVIAGSESIVASPTSLSFAAQDADAQVVQLTVSDGTKWTAVCSNSWIKANPSSGTGSANVTVTAYNSTSTSARTGKITFQNSSKSVTAVVEVSQDAYVAPEPIEGNVVPDPAPFDGTKRSSTTYQLLVYSFADSDGDGIGDFKGIQNKLDYLDELGVTALWLSPIHPSDSYHGYDVQDYYKVNPLFGTEQDFKNLVDAAHLKGIAIYIDYVLNHSGVGNKWFTEAVSSESSPYRSYYQISTNPQADISAGNFPSVPFYASSQWYDASVKSITVTTTSDAVTPDNPSAKVWIYEGDAVLHGLTETSPGIHEGTFDINTNWGFLVKDHKTEWGSHKYGATTVADAVVNFGSTMKIMSGDAAKDIVFGSVNKGYTGRLHFRVDWTNPAVKYYGSFGSWMPDLDYGAAASASSSAAFLDLAVSAKKWIDLGVDGFRLDAVKHIYESGHTAGQTQANATFLKQWYDTCNDYFHTAGGNGNIFMVGEAWDSPFNETQYYKGLISCFEFSYWGLLYDALVNGNASNYASTVAGWIADHKAVRPDAITSLFMTNHDHSSKTGDGEARAADDLGKNLAKEKQAAAMILTTEGKPFIYQGEELGYWGNAKGKGDEYIRTPIMWDRNGNDCAKKGVNDKVDASMLTSAISVEAQSANEASLLNNYRTFVRLRNTYEALASGTMTKANVSGTSIAAWYMTSGSERLLVVHNVSTSQKSVNLPATDDLSHPVALLGKAEVSGNKLTLDGNSSVVFQL